MTNGSQFPFKSSQEGVPEQGIKLHSLAHLQRFCEIFLSLGYEVKLQLVHQLIKEVLHISQFAVEGEM